MKIKRTKRAASVISAKNWPTDRPIPFVIGDEYGTVKTCFYQYLRHNYFYCAEFQSIEHGKTSDFRNHNLFQMKIIRMWFVQHWGQLQRTHALTSRRVAALSQRYSFFTLWNMWYFQMKFYSGEGCVTELGDKRARYGFHPVSLGISGGCVTVRFPTVSFLLWNMACCKTLVIRSTPHNMRWCMPWDSIILTAGQNPWYIFLWKYVTFFQRGPRSLHRYYKERYSSRIFKSIWQGEHS